MSEAEVARVAFQRAWARVVEAAPAKVGGIREIMSEEWMAFFSKPSPCPERRNAQQQVRDE